ncbi:hypothetical protein SAMN06265222_105104 [Neorhodopirellula lusitana]|uniref:Uncharacterized protein n=1 Tax=Neorhodopirellula lusitana TaxID=445327 RepID=A0ABY1Q2K5_9BACT|nr:hypothetical protein [Neorhodopirellula lusitana]SMP56194.1 hypothetical protein SAMN06265222_105104 [Neorhodopirellula lusitana]
MTKASLGRKSWFTASVCPELLGVLQIGADAMQPEAEEGAWKWLSVSDVVGALIVRESLFSRKEKPRGVF